MLLQILILIVCVLVLQASAQLLCIWMDSRKFSAPGKLIRLPGRTVHVQQQGVGAPPVILEAGIAASSLSWSVLQPQISAFTSTFSYDRAGLGWSTAAGGEFSVSRMADQLRQWIEALNVSRPYVLAGHSYAAYILRVFARRFPDDIAGIILIDPLTPEEWIKPTSAQRWQVRRAVWFSRAGSVLVALGVIRCCLWLLQRGNNAAPRRIVSLFGPQARETVERILRELAKLPPATTRLIRERWGHPGFFLTMARYIHELPASAAEVSRYEIPPHIPVTVISGAHQPRIRMVEHEAIAAHSLHGRHIVAAKSAHWVHLDQPELIVEAVREMMAGSAAESAPASH